MEDGRRVGDGCCHDAHIEECCWACVWLETPGSEFKSDVEIFEAFLIGLDGQPKVVVAEGLTDALLDISNLPWCCDECR